MAANFRLVKCVLVRKDSGDDIRRIRLEQPLALDALKKAIEERFHLIESDSVTLTYKDDEDETVTVGCSEDLQEALLQFPADAATHLKFFIKTSQAPAEQAPAEQEKSETPEQQPSGDPGLEDFLEHFSAAAHGAIDSPVLPSVLKEFMESFAAEVAVGAEPSDSPCGPSFPHHGIVCDGCNMSPLMGPRFKSSPKQDFDLCQKCFNKTSDKDFKVRQLPFSEWQPLAPAGQSTARPSSPRAESHHCPRGKNRRCHRDNWRCERPQNSSAQSRFVRDVTIWDGTQMTPSTPFTKIWTVRNDGAEPWPEGTSLAFVSGDSMSGSLVNKLSFNAPVAPGAEVEVAVDLIAPQETGRYIGYWRLSSEDGCRFGQRIWVQIQVVQPGEEAAVSVGEEEEGPAADDTDVTSLTIKQLKTRLARQNLDASSCLEKQELIALLRNKMPGNSAAQVAHEAAHQAHQEAHHAAHAEAQKTAQQAHEAAVAAATAAEQAVATEQEAAQEAVASAGGTAEEGAIAEEASEAAQDKALVAEHEAGAAAQTADQAAEEQAIAVAAAEAAKEMLMAASAPAEEDTAASSDGDFIDVQDGLLMEGATALATMGFEDVDLNSALLEKNEGNVEKTALQLLSLKQWEQGQRDLQEMGFSDTLNNSLLLLKHAGRTTLVVRDLVQTEK